MTPNDEGDAADAMPAEETRPAQSGQPSRESAFPGMVAAVYAPRCDGCGDCAEACPADAITILVLAEVDPFACTGCGRCVAACPREAIAMQQP